MKTFDCVQASPEWWQLRRGVPTSSSFDRIITPKTGKPAAAIEEYIAELIADRACLTPNYFSQFGISRPMQNGKDTEPEARRYYEMERGHDVRQVGFCLSDCGRFGCSPDGLIGDEGGLELKCPLLKTQVAYQMNGSLPAEYKPQVHGSLIVTGRKWWDFLAYAPGIAPLLIRVTPDEYTDQLRVALELFWDRYEEASMKILGKPALVQNGNINTPILESIGADND